MSFSYYSPLTINSGQVPSTQTDFPLLVSITDDRLKTVANGGHVQSSSGFDIRPYSDTGLTTAITGYELVFYDGANGILEMHVKRSSVSDGLVTYLAYGDSSITTDGTSTTTWSNSFLGVYHLADGTTLNVNSATGSNNGTNHGATATTGKIDGGGGFASASSQYIDFGTGINPASITLSIWVKATTLTPAYSLAIGRVGGSQNYTNIQVKSNGKLCCAAGRAPGNTRGYDGTGSTTLSTGTWYRLTLTCSSSGGLKGYVNGSQDNTSTGLDSDVAGATSQIGGTQGVDPFGNYNTGYWNGPLDEAYFANVIRSADWITTEYNNQSDPSTFMTLGAEAAQLSQVLTAALSFAGSVSRIDYKGFSSALSFVGSSSKKDYKGISGILSFIGIPAKLLPPKILTGTLSFTGDLFRRIGTLVYAVFTSTLKFIALDPDTVTPGALLKSTHHPIPAVLSFVGSLHRIIKKSLASVLSFIGTLAATGGSLLLKSLTASLSFSGKITRSTSHHFTALLSFIGSRVHNISQQLSTFFIHH